MRQVYENAESTIRQYALKDKLVSLGWAQDMIEVIDCDLGRSGAEAASRDGFRQMLADVGEGNVGAIASIECSRLSRHSGDWGRLTEICALSGTILIDDDGIYDPNDFNDRLLLGLKGTMSEAELHFLRGRMRGGALNKAERGELRYTLPVGYVYDEAGKMIKDPDAQVQGAVALFFESYRICGTANMVARYYGEKGYLFPTDRNRGFGNKTDVYWEALTPSRAMHVLKSPAYAGAYAYGRFQTKNTINGKKRRRAAESDIISFIEDHHEPYITLDEYRMNCEQLSANNTRKGASVPREGNALLPGIALCAKCGSRLSVQYKNEKGATYWQYICGHVKKGEPFSHKRCICISGRVVDQAVSDIILQKLTPEAVKAAEEIWRELDDRKSAEDKYFILQIEKANYEAELAKKRYMNADPENRLVAAELERLWNERMTQLAKASEDLNKHRNALKPKQVEPNIEELFTFPERLNNAWQNDDLKKKKKKRIIRCLVEDVTFALNGDDIVIGIRFIGGLTECISVCRPQKKYETWTTAPEIVEFVRESSKKHTVEEIMEQLNAQGEKSGKGNAFTLASVRGIQYQYGIPSLKAYLRSIGYISTEEKADKIGISANALNKRRKSGLYTDTCVKTTGGGDYLYAP
jgi:DNA invertase Pin-like site-specific DNA recombinase